MSNVLFSPAYQAKNFFGTYIDIHFSGSVEQLFPNYQALHFLGVIVNYHQTLATFSSPRA
jgi:hypothetical protein